jgi:tRNA A37 threonylcarbamoyladenosine modification protein TsaB
MVFRLKPGTFTGMPIATGIVQGIVVAVDRPKAIRDLLSGEAEQKAG